MNKGLILLLGAVLIVSGLLMGAYSLKQEKEAKDKRALVTEKLKEGEILLEQSNPKSIEKAREIFSELYSKENSEPYKFRILYGLANSLEQTGDKLKALEYYKELNQFPNLTNEEKDKLSLSLGKILLLLNREEEGKIHLKYVLKNSQNSKLRSLALTYIADFHLDKNDLEKALKDYILAIEEDPSNYYAKQQLEKLSKLMGIDWRTYNDSPKEITEKPATAKKTKPKLSYYQRGKQSFINKKYWTAIRNFKRAIPISKSVKQKEKVLWYIGESYNAVNRLQQSIEYMDKVLENPDMTLDQAAVFRKGTVNFRLNKYEEALVLFQETINKYPKSYYTDKAEEYKKETQKILTDANEFEDGKEAPSVTPTEKKPDEGSESFEDESE
jgi:tetratricopeptide (TPR) repeat protein